VARVLREIVLIETGLLLLTRCLDYAVAHSERRCRRANAHALWGSQSALGPGMNRVWSDKDGIVEDVAMLVGRMQVIDH
jgi:hypothetical protein